MHGGVKVYRGTAAAARNYVEADRSRADDYYLAEGTGVARRFAAGPDGPVVELASLTGDGYEAWVAGLDPETGRAARAVAHRRAGGAVRRGGGERAEVVVAGGRAAPRCRGSVRGGARPRGGADHRLAWPSTRPPGSVRAGAQVAVPVERLEAVTVRHYTSRAGDPHRHLHLQVNARVFAAGKWRGLDTVAFRDSITASTASGTPPSRVIRSSGPRWPAHGYTLNGAGEIEQLASFVGAFSKRAAQIAALLDRYEADWRHEHPGAEPGPALRRAWDARAWAEDRPDKVIPRSGDELRQRWLAELAGLGYRDRDTPIQLALPMPGTLDRDAAVAEVVARLGAARSAWNAADVRGEVEHLLARIGHRRRRAAVRLRWPRTSPPARSSCACRCASARHPNTSACSPPGTCSTSRPTLSLGSPRAARPAGSSAERSVASAAVDGLDAGQRAAVAALAGDGGDWSWSRARPVPARRRCSPPPVTSSTGSASDWSW